MNNNHRLPSVAGMVVFAHLVETGSFTAAAARLGLSKASISRELAALEARLGAQLLVRTTRRMSVTEAGHLFYERCRRVVEEAEDAERSIHQLQAEPHGTLRLTVPMSFGVHQIAPRIERFLVRHPSLKVEIDTLVGTLDYGPVRVATATMGYKHRSADLDAVRASLAAPNFLLKIIPHVDGTARICEIVEYQLEDVVLKGAWVSPAALSLQPHALAPVAELPVLEVVSALHMVCDLTLGLGKVVHDYLR